MPMWIQISEKQYWDALEVLPPAAQAKSAFLIGEPTDHQGGLPRFGAYLEKDGVWYHLDEPINHVQFRAVVDGTADYEFSTEEPPTEKARALGAYLEVEPSELVEESDNRFSLGRKEYWVLTDDEANEAWDGELERYIDECLEIPEAIRPYFDEEKWKNDARHDGRGHCLSSYDGHEHEVKVDGEWFYIYRVN